MIYLNQFFLHSDLPFRVVSFSISSLQGTLSYAAVLHDGCKFRANNIDIILEPVSLSETNKSDKKINKDDLKRAGFKSENGENLSRSVIDRSRESFMSGKGVHASNVPEKSDEGQEGLNFIANWIEVVLARLEIHVENLNIIVNDIEISKSSLRILLKQATFFNTNPKMLSNR